MTREEAARLPYEERLRLASDHRTPTPVLEAVHGSVFDVELRDPFGADPFADEPDDSLDRARAIRAALAGNPNTPPPCLADLATECPAEFCANPVAPLLALEWPQAAEHLDWQRLPALLRRADVPASLVAAVAAQSPYACSRAEAALHVAARAGGADEGEDWRTEARAALRDLAEEQARCGRYISTRLRQAVTLGIAPPWLFEVRSLRGLGVYRKSDEQRAALRRKLTSEFLPPHLPWADSCPVRCFVLAGRRRSQGLRRWADCDAWADRLGVALNPRSRKLPEALAVLAADGIRPVREAARARLRGEDVAL